MKTEDILDALPVNYYVIDLTTKKILHTNDSKLSTGEAKCFQQLFNNSKPCMLKEDKCFCQQVMDAENQDDLVLKTGEASDKRYFKASVKELNDAKIVACFTEITFEKNASKDLKINKKRLERAESLAAFGSWEIDFNKQIMIGSQGACDIYGIEEKVLPLDQARKIPLPEYRQALDKELDDLIHGRKKYNICFRIKRPLDGEIRFVQSVAEYHEDKNRVVGVIKDITERIYFEKALQESVADLRLAQDIARLGNWKYDALTKTLTISEQINQIIDIYEVPAHPELKDFKKLTGKEHYRLFSEAIILALRKGIPFEKQFRIMSRNNSEKWIEIICRPEAEPGQAGHVLKGTLQDITLTKTVENELQHSNRLFRTLIQNLPDAIYMKDTGCRKIIANVEDARNCGMQSPEQVIGKTDYEIYPLEIANKYFEDDRQVIDKGIPVINREEMLPGNPARWILTTKVPLSDKDGGITGLVGIGHDITRRKLMEEELKAAKLRAEESDRLKSAFLANMSHEIRTPLNGILGFSNLICSGNADIAQLSNYCTLMEECGQRLTSIIDNIIDLSLIQSRQLKLNPCRFNLVELMEELYEFYKKQKKEQLAAIDFRFTNSLEGESAEFYYDRNRIRQVLINLLDNAFKFTLKGYIEMGCSRSDEGGLNIFVNDSGIGIEESKLEIIFENFRQAEEGFTRQYEGAGLGLTIVSGIISRMGGNIRVNSKSGSGSAFKVQLPVRKFNGGEAKDVALPGEFQQVVFKKKEPEKLIVSFEDDIASMEYLKNVAALLGCRLINFDNPVMGIDYLRKNRADLIFMDVRMPEMSGFEATKIIKTEFPNLPVIIQTAYALKEDREKAFMAGCDDYLAKPVPLKELRGRIRHYIGEQN